MKKLFLSIVAICATFMVMASDVVTLTVNGQGVTKEAATASALRSAIEQAFGVFVSANTQILNDSLVKDEIATVSSGNIQQYSEVACVNMPNGEVAVTLSATVAISKLVAYAKSHGSSAEFAGQTFAMNMKMLELNKQNEEKALQHTYLQLEELAKHMFDWKLEVGSPVVSGEHYSIGMLVTAMSNEASDAFYKTLMGTLRSLSLTPIQVTEYQNTNVKYHSIGLRLCFPYSGYPNNPNTNLSSLGCDAEDMVVFNFRSPFINDFLKGVHELIRIASISFEIRETADSTRIYDFCERIDPMRLVGVYRRGDITEDEYMKYELMCSLGRSADYSETNISRYVIGKCIYIWNLPKYAIQVVKKKKMPEPIIYRNEVLAHPVAIKIEKDRISSIAGFEVVRDQKYKIDIEYSPYQYINLGNGKYLLKPRGEVIDKHCMPVN